MKRFGLWIYDAYQYIFDSSKNPLRHIPDPTSRMFIMTILAFMWSGTFAVYLGSITYFGLSVAAHIVLILMFFLANVRTVIISITAIPLSLVITLIVLKAFDLTVNTMTQRNYGKVILICGNVDKRKQDSPLVERKSQRKCGMISKRNGRKKKRIKEHVHYVWKRRWRLNVQLQKS